MCGVQQGPHWTANQVFFGFTYFHRLSLLVQMIIDCYGWICFESFTAKNTRLISSWFIMVHRFHEPALTCTQLPWSLVAIRLTWSLVTVRCTARWRQRNQWPSLAKELPHQLGLECLVQTDCTILYQHSEHSTQYDSCHTIWTMGTSLHLFTASFCFVLFLLDFPGTSGVQIGSSAAADDCGACANVWNAPVSCSWIPWHPLAVCR
jgi:hypothetical protein